MARRRRPGLRAKAEVVVLAAWIVPVVALAPAGAKLRDVTESSELRTENSAEGGGHG